MILLDTDTLTLFDHGHENVRRRMANSFGLPVAITVVTRNESLLGRAANLLKAADEAELRIAIVRLLHAEKLLASFPIIGFDDAAIAHFGRLRKQKNLKKIGRPDLLIACIALARNALLVTRNTKDYRDIPGLRIENWVD